MSLHFVQFLALVPLQLSQLKWQPVHLASLPSSFHFGSAQGQEKVCLVGSGFGTDARVSLHLRQSVDNGPEHS